MKELFNRTLGRRPKKPENFEKLPDGVLEAFKTGKISQEDFDRFVELGVREGYQYVSPDTWQQMSPDLKKELTPQERKEFKKLLKELRKKTKEIYKIEKEAYEKGKESLGYLNYNLGGIKAKRFKK